MKKPNLFIIGQHKAGTSALCTFLGQHPDIFFHKLKELHHFESDFLLDKIASHNVITKNLLKRYNATLEYYLDNYKGVDTVIIGDKTPSYLYSITSAMEIFNFNPSAKIIALFREPVSYLYSLHSQNLYNLYENEENFKKAILLEESRKKGDNIPRRGKKVKHMLFYCDKIKYSMQLKRFLNIFPKEQIKCILFEDFKNNNEAVVKDVFKFLGVDDHFKHQFEIINSNKRRRFRFLKNMINRMAFTGIPAKIIPKSQINTFGNFFNRISTTYEKRKTLDPVIANELKVKFKDEVICFNKLLHEYGFIEEEKNLIKLWQYDDI